MFSNLLVKWWRERLRPKRPYGLLQIEPTLQCGLSCVMCPWTDLRAQAGSMTWETFQRIVPYLPLAREVDFTGGGEPTLNPHLVEMVAAARQAGCQVGFSTNGVRLTPDLAERLLALDLDWVSFSVDAATAEVYERIRQGARFDTVCANIAALRDLKAARRSRRPRLMMVFVMMSGAQENFRQLPEYIDLAHSLGVEQVIAKNLDVILKAGDDDRRLFSHTGPPAAEVSEVLAQAQARAKKLGVVLRQYAFQPQELPVCEPDPLHNVFFNWEGFVSPCISLSYAEERYFNGQPVTSPCQRFGNINQQSLEEIWSGRAYQAFRQAFAKRRLWERQVLLEGVLGGEPGQQGGLPLAPESCRTCYYLYGI